MATDKRIVVGNIYPCGPWAPCHKIKFDPVNYGVICIDSRQGVEQQKVDVMEPNKPGGNQNDKGSPFQDLYWRPKQT